MNKLLVICGPTATGKTSLAIKLAKEFNGELISADSRQVYQGMDIGTGKDRPKKVKIHLIDVVKPNQEFSASQYYRLAWKTIKKIWKKGKLPILVGGTGFYIKTVVDGVETKDIPRNLELRVKTKDWSKEKLLDYLLEIDPERAAAMNKSDKNNPYRLVRAIEVAVFKQENPDWKPIEHRESDNLFIGLIAPFEILDKKIHQRVKERVEQGIENEIKKLLRRGYGWDNSAVGDTIGYKEWQPYFEGKEEKEKIIELWERSECQYARRQMTWFKKDRRINWFDISQKGWENETKDLVRDWGTEKND